MKVDSKDIISLASLAVLLFIGWIDYVTGYELGFFIFYFVPVSLSAWYVNRRTAFLMAFASAATWYLSDLYTFHPYSNAFFIYWETFMRLISFLTTGLTVSRIRELVNNERRLNAELMGALAEVGELQRLLPVCHLCGQQHSDETVRERIANYLEARRGLEPSRTFCPECGRDCQTSSDT